MDRVPDEMKIAQRLEILNWGQEFDDHVWCKILNIDARRLSGCVNFIMSTVRRSSEQLSCHQLEAVIERSSLGPALKAISWRIGFHDMEEPHHVLPALVTLRLFGRPIHANVVPGRVEYVCPIVQEAARWHGDNRQFQIARSSRPSGYVDHFRAMDSLMPSDYLCGTATACYADAMYAVVSGCSSPEMAVRLKALIVLIAIKHQGRYYETYYWQLLRRLALSSDALAHRFLGQFLPFGSGGRALSYKHTMHLPRDCYGLRPPCIAVEAFALIVKEFGCLWHDGRDSPWHFGSASPFYGLTPYVSPHSEVVVDYPHALDSIFEKTPCPDRFASLEASLLNRPEVQFFWEYNRIWLLAELIAGTSSGRVLCTSAGMNAIRDLSHLLEQYNGEPERALKREVDLVKSLLAGNKPDYVTFANWAIKAIRGAAAKAQLDKSLLSGVIIPLLYYCSGYEHFAEALRHYTIKDDPAASMLIDLVVPYSPLVHIGLKDEILFDQPVLGWASLTFATSLAQFQLREVISQRPSPRRPRDNGLHPTQNIDVWGPYPFAIVSGAFRDTVVDTSSHGVLNFYLPLFSRLTRNYLWVHSWKARSGHARVSRLYFFRKQGLVNFWSVAMGPTMTFKFTLQIASEDCTNRLPRFLRIRMLVDLITDPAHDENDGVLGNRVRFRVQNAAPVTFCQMLKGRCLG